jgi:hypothetical protein
MNPVYGFVIFHSLALLSAYFILFCRQELSKAGALVVMLDSLLRTKERREQM